MALHTSAQLLPARRASRGVGGRLRAVGRQPPLQRPVGPRLHAGLGQHPALSSLLVVQCAPSKGWTSPMSLSTAERPYSAVRSANYRRKSQHLLGVSCWSTSGPQAVIRLGSMAPQGADAPPVAPCQGGLVEATAQTQGEAAATSALGEDMDNPGPGGPNTC